MAKDIDAKVVIRADTTQAVAGVKALGKEASAIPGSVAPAGKALDDLGKKTEANTKRVQDATRRLALLRPQLTDIITGLATGQSPFTVLLQQGGQLGDVFGGFGNALKALGTVFTPLRLLLGGVAAGLGTVAFQAFRGASESDALRKSLALTGNIAGTSAGQLDTLARSIAAATKASILDTREALAEVVASGQFTGGAIESVTRSVLVLGKLTGQTAAESLKQFTALVGGVSAGAAKLNQQYNFLTAEQFKLIRGLEAQGRTQEALRVLTTAFSDVLEGRAVTAVRGYARAWARVSNVLDGVLDSIRALFRDSTPEDKLAALTARLKDLTDQRDRFAKARPGASNPFEPLAAETAQQVAAQKRQVELNNLGAALQADAKRAAQEVAKKGEKGYQDSLSAITAAGARKRLAGELQDIERRKSAIERDHALSLIGEEEFARRSGDIELERLSAERTALQTTLASERAKLVKGGDSQEKNAQQARVKQLEAELITMGTRIQAAADKTETELAALQFASAREKAQAYGEVWQRAAQQVASFAQSAAETRARLLSDPVKRAQAEADAATAAARKQRDDTELELGKRIDIAKTNDPNVVPELQRQLAALRAVAKAAIEEADRAERVRSFRAQLGEGQARLQSDEDAITQRVQEGLLTEADGERKILDLRRQQIPELERIAALIKAIATSPEEKQALADEENRIKAKKDFREELEKTARSQAVGGLAGALTDIATGAKTGKEALLDMVASFAKAMLDVLNRKLAEQLVKQFSDAVGSGGGAGGGGFFNWLASVFSFHSGGIVGAGGGPMRTVSPLAFALAPRYHGGGIAGLMPDEVPAVLRRGEEVLRADDPRHRRNGGSASDINSTVNVSVTTDGASSEQAGQFGQVLGRAVKATVHEVLIDQMRPGGILARR